MSESGLLQNVSDVKARVEEIEQIDEKLSYYHSIPLGEGLKKKVTVVMLNGAIIALTMALMVGIHVAMAIPCLAIMYFVRGGTIVDYLNKRELDLKLKKSDDDIKALLKRKAELRDQLISKGLVEDKYLSSQALRRFEELIQEGKAESVEKCIEILENENKTAAV